MNRSIIAAAVSAQQIKHRPKLLFIIYLHEESSRPSDSERSMPAHRLINQRVKRFKHDFPPSLCLGHPWTRKTPSRSAKSQVNNLL